MIHLPDLRLKGEGRGLRVHRFDGESKPYRRRTLVGIAQMREAGEDIS